MAAVLVQSTTSDASQSLSTTPTTYNFGVNVTNGNSVIVVVSSNNAGAVLTIDETTNGTYTLAIQNDQPGVSGLASISYKHAVTGGFTGVRVAADSSISFCMVGIYEVSGLANSAPTTGSADTVAATPFPCASPGLSGSGFAMGAGMMQQTGGTVTPASGFTLSSGNTLIAVQQYKIGTLTNDTASWSVSGDGVAASGVLTIFSEPTAPSTLGGYLDSILTKSLRPSAFTPGFGR